MCSVVIKSWGCDGDGDSDGAGGKDEENVLMLVSVHPKRFIGPKLGRC